MKVRDLLAREHAMFRRLLDILEFNLAHPEARARAEMTEALRTLLPALDRHEELEDLVFEAPPSARDPREALARVAEQHRTIGHLRDEVLYELELSEKCPFERLRSLSRFLIENLRAHLATEETLLWPHFQDVLEKTLDLDLANPLHRRARVLEKQLRRGLTAIASSFR